MAWMSAEVSLAGMYSSVAGNPLAVLGWSAEELQSQPGLDLGDPRDVDVAAAAYMAALEAVSMRYVGRVVGKDGKSRWVRATISKESDPRGKAARFVVAMRPTDPPADGTAWFDAQS